MSKEKILFLDFDGVLNPTINMIALHKMWEQSKGEIKSKDEFGDLFFSQNIDALYKILSETNCKIVISSAWRYIGFQRLREMWVSRNLPFIHRLIGFTTTEQEVLLHDNIEFFDSICRGNEIDLWIRKNNFQGNYCIIDDTDDMLDSQKDNFVLIDSRFGLTNENAEQIIKILNK